MEKTADGFSTVLPILQLNGTEAVESIELRRTVVGPVAACIMGKTIAFSTAVTHLSLRYNQMGPHAANAVAEALRVNTKLTKLSLMGENIKQEGLIVIADALRMNTTLTSLDVSSNKDTVKQLLQETLKNREGFQLQL